MRTRVLLSAVLACATICVASASAQDGTTPPTNPPATPPQTQPVPAPTEAKEKIVYVKMTTSMGDIVLELDGEKAPISVENFMNYVNKGHYDGTIFHRVIDGFMIQGGGFTPDLKQKPVDNPIKNEWKNGLKNKAGTIAMARTNVADSATSQFFINVNDNDFLDTPRDGAAYAVFGKVVGGMDVVNKIKGVRTGMRSGGMSDVPIEPVMIQKTVKITREEAIPAGNG
ncbi:MAG: peptidyl-prolyl cis-trans isomerase [Phycisphaeraceae bacterium]|nr:peptidyl-prolyl cis-trans isomerase [Phycisphaeraceae bacterium]MBX3366686.1 peptidyl-prolyl cis-trans isomerase [Phycisphaeraceae bacterium]